MTWIVEFCSEEALEELDALTPDLQAKFNRIIALVKAKGLENVHEPYSKHLKGKLWEFRLMGKDKIARTIYATASGRRIIILHTFIKKTQKTPSMNLDIATSRANDFGIKDL